MARLTGTLEVTVTGTLEKCCISGRRFGQPTALSAGPGQPGRRIASNRRPLEPSPRPVCLRRPSQSKRRRRTSARTGRRARPGRPRAAPPPPRSAAAARSPAVGSGRSGAAAPSAARGGGRRRVSSALDRAAFELDHRVGLGRSRIRRDRRERDPVLGHRAGQPVDEGRAHWRVVDRCRGGVVGASSSRSYGSPETPGTERSMPQARLADSSRASCDLLDRRRRSAPAPGSAAGRGGRRRGRTPTTAVRSRSATG